MKNPAKLAALVDTIELAETTMACNVEEKVVPPPWRAGHYWQAAEARQQTCNPEPVVARQQTCNPEPGI